MWLMIMYDLPNVTRSEKSYAKKFQKELKKDGFSIFQKSIYIRYCFSDKKSYTHKTRIRKMIKHGNIAIIELTDIQFESMYVFCKNPTDGIRKPDIITFY